MSPKMTSRSKEERKRREIEETLNGDEAIPGRLVWEALGIFILLLILIGALAWAFTEGFS